MVTAQYVYTCDECGESVADGPPCQVICGIDQIRPSLPEGWTLLSKYRGSTVRLICDKHAVVVDVPVCEPTL